MIVTNDNGNIIDVEKKIQNYWYGPKYSDLNVKSLIYRNKPQNIMNKLEEINYLAVLILIYFLFRF